PSRRAGCDRGDLRRGRDRREPPSRSRCPCAGREPGARRVGRPAVRGPAPHAAHARGGRIHEQHLIGTVLHRDPRPGAAALRQRPTDPAWLGRAFAVSMALNFAGFPIGSALGGAIVPFSIELTFAVAIVTNVAAAAMTFLWLPRED